MIEHAGVEQSLEVLFHGFDAARKSHDERVPDCSCDGTGERREDGFLKRAGEQQVDDAGCSAFDERGDRLLSLKNVSRVDEDLLG